jgi:hypothetical protein
MKRAISILAIYSSLISPVMASSLTVHEWGTFTSFMGSNGELIEGLHHEDEPLPAFVHGLKKQSLLDRGHQPSPRRCPINSKVGCSTFDNLVQTHSEIFPEAPISSGITQKMETPVIYFYGDAGKKINVEINFPQGIITQYFPEATFSYPTVNEARELKDSRFVFDVTLLKATDMLNLPVTQKESIWNPARAVPEANTISVNNGEKEKFIFYRGVGNFTSPLKVSSDTDDVLTLDNLSQSNISMAIVLNSNGKFGNIKTIYNLNKQQKLRVPDLGKGMAFDQYIEKTKSVIAEELIKNGLYKDEAVAMVNTWEKSYFHTPGIRVLYIVPSEDTETILPLSVKPAPNELKRVLVGRVEVMTKNEEAAYLKIIGTQAGAINTEDLFGRFFEPKLRRLEQIAPLNLKEKIRALL